MDERRLPTLRHGTAAAVAVGLLLVGCGGPAVEVEEDLAVVQAEAVPFEDSGLAPPDAPTPEEVPPAEPDPPAEDAAEAESGPSDDADSSQVGPTSSDAAAFVASSALEDLTGVEHVVVDLDDDTWPEVVATGISDRVGVLRVAWWTADGYEVLAEDLAGSGRDVTDLRAADVNADGHTELLVAVEGDGLGSLAVWAVPRRGAVARLAADGGCHDGSHVYGVTRARLQEQAEGPPAIVADCDESPLPVADWGEQRWVWQDGAYRFEEPDGPGNGRAPDHAGPKDDDDRGAGDDDDDD